MYYKFIYTYKIYKPYETQNSFFENLIIERKLKEYE